MTTMARLQKELDSMDQTRQDPSPQGYTTQTVSSARLYTNQPKKFAPVTAPKPYAAKPKVEGGSSLPPPGPHTSKAIQSHTQVSYPKPEDFIPPPPPAAKPSYSSYPGDEPLPPPPPELIGGGGAPPSDYSMPPPPPPPPAPVTMQTYNEPRPPPQPQPSYKPAAYQQRPPPQQKPLQQQQQQPQQQQNGASAAYKPIPYQGSSTGGSTMPKPIPPEMPVGAGSIPRPTDQPVSAPAKTGTEAEIDALTNLLMQNMEVTPEEGEFFGICAKCGQKVIGDNNGCTAMDQVYHIDCFTCDTCHTKLRGHPFFALEGKAYCETCYMDSLEKCSTCSQPITERILRATGKPYHPHCFTCVVCGKSLDGVPFTVDATNQIHCIEDFHKKFAPRCSVCLQPIMPETGQEETVRIVALDRSFHVNCYKCEDCGALLSSEADGRGCFPLDDHILCRDCNTKRVQALTAP